MMVTCKGFDIELIFDNNGYSLIFWGKKKRKRTKNVYLFQFFVHFCSRGSFPTTGHVSDCANPIPHSGVRLGIDDSEKKLNFPKSILPNFGNFLNILSGIKC